MSVSKGAKGITSPRFHPTYVWATLGFAVFINFAQAEGEKSIDSLIAKPSMNIVLSTSNVAEVKKFYGEVLGLKPMTPLHLPGGLEMTRFLVGTSEIKFLPPRGEVPRETGAIDAAIGIRMLGFYFSDVDKVTARFREHGYPIPSFQSQGPTGRKSAFVSDPDGNMIQLIVPPAGAEDETYDKLDIGLTVSDTEASRKFYGQFVALEELDPLEIPAHGITRYSYRHGTTTIKLWTYGKDLPKQSGRWQDAYGIRYIQYIMSDLDAVEAHAKATGADIHTPIFDLGAMARIMFIADPDGIINEFVGGPKRD